MLTYKQAAGILAAALNRGRTGKKIGHNTWLVPGPMLGDVSVRYHRTNIVTLHADGAYTLRSGGWETVTTKARINRYAPVRLYQEKGEWRIADPLTGGYWPFLSGMVVSSLGLPIGSPWQYMYVPPKVRRTTRGAMTTDPQLSLSMEA